MPKDMGFKKYTKIHRFGTAENEDIFNYPVTITEKIDGANTRVMKYDGKIYYGSHNQMLAEDTDNKMWGGFVKWVLSKDWSNLPEGCMLYGEWMKKHTIDYGLKEPEFYAFDMFDVERDTYYGFDSLQTWCAQNNINYIPCLFQGETSKEEAEKLIKKSFLNPEIDMEGIAIKAYGQRNSFGRHVFAKIVREKFREAADKVFNKGGKLPLEQIICDKYTNKARITKSLQRLMEEGKYERDMRDMRYLKDYVYDDIIEEEYDDIVDEILKDVTKRVRSKIAGTVVKLYKEMLSKDEAPAVKE